MMNYYIPEPFVKPRDSVAVYTVHGMNEWGCHDSANITIRVIFDEEEYIPTAFTPNGDGVNDLLLDGLELSVFDRNGLIIYKGNSGWDGTYNGKSLDNDSYFYTAQYTDINNQLHTKKGFVTLIR